MSNPNAMMRIILRWTHLLVGFLIGAFVYTPAREDDAFVLLMQAAVVPAVTLSDGQAQNLFWTLVAPFAASYSIRRDKIERSRRDGSRRVSRPRGHVPGGPARDPGPARRGEWRGL